MANKIQVTKLYIQIIADANDAAFLRLISEVNGVEPQRARNTYRCSLHKLPEVLRVLRGIETPEQLSSPMRELLEAELQRRRHTADLMQKGPETLYPGLWEHQSLGADLARYNSRFNFFYDTRTGKTRMSYQIIYNAIKEGRAKRCLVVAPSAIIPDWLGDAASFPMLKVRPYYKDAQTRDAALRLPSHVIIWSAGTFANDLELIKRIKFDMVIFDESSKLKNHRSQMAKAALELSATVPSWYNLSATPAPNGEHEYYAQMRCVDPYSFDSARTHFVHKYFINLSNSNKFEKLTINPVMRDAFMAVIKDYSVFVDQSVIPTTEKIWQVVTYPMAEETHEAYKRMAKDAALQLPDNTITADQASLVRAKLAQLTSGFILDTEAIQLNKVSRKLGEKANECEVYKVGPGERLVTLHKVLEFIRAKEPDARVIIWANYAQEFADIAELLGDSCRVVRGGTTTAAKENIIGSFRRGAFRYLVAHPLSVGMGINLTVAHWAVYYSINDSWEALKQSSERICGHIRIQPFDCRYLVIAAQGSIDETIYDNVIHKRDSSLDILNHIKAVALQ